MITISLCMIVKNKEVIDRYLDSIHGFIDEINIGDTSSTDRTKEIIQISKGH